MDKRIDPLRHAEMKRLAKHYAGEAAKAFRREIEHQRAADVFSKRFCDGLPQCHPGKEGGE